MGGMGIYPRRLARPFRPVPFDCTWDKQFSELGCWTWHPTEIQGDFGAFGLHGGRGAMSAKPRQIERFCRLHPPNSGGKTTLRETEVPSRPVLSRLYFFEPATQDLVLSFVSRPT